MTNHPKGIDQSGSDSLTALLGMHSHPHHCPQLRPFLFFLYLFSPARGEPAFGWSWHHFLLVSSFLAGRWALSLFWSTAHSWDSWSVLGDLSAPEAAAWNTSVFSRHGETQELIVPGPFSKRKGLLWKITVWGHQPGSLKKLSAGLHLRILCGVKSVFWNERSLWWMSVELYQNHSH